VSQGRERRIELIEALQRARGGRVVIAYVTATRSWLSADMRMDVIPRLYRHLRGLGLRPGGGARIDVFLHSDGGDGAMGWRLMSLLREFAAEVAVLVPHRAFSAATLTALGADQVLMHPMGMLGPIDPTVYSPFNPPDPDDPGYRLGIGVEDVAAFIRLLKEDVGVHQEGELVLAFNKLADRIHPLALGRVRRITGQSGLLAAKLLRSRGTADAGAIEEIVEGLGSKLRDHGHPISRAEARTDLGLDFVVPAPDDVEAAMWDLYLAYCEEMKLEEEWEPVLEALGQAPLPPPPVKAKARARPAPNTDTRRIAPVRTVMLETAARCDVREATYEVTLSRAWNGRLNHWIEAVERAWSVV
jgi:Serine dehydrogenase proteinase